MIVTNSKPYGVIKGMLKPWKKTGIFSCNSCARACETVGIGARDFKGNIIIIKKN